MAAAQDIGDMAKCPICLENYKEPRKLPNCGHSYCEECIVTYVGKLLDNKEAANGVACPFCRTHNSGPKSKDGIRAWSESLEIAENIGCNSDEQENTDNNNCDSCSLFGISTKATKLCHNCVEMLCVSCSMGRHSQRSSRNHKVTDLEMNMKHAKGDACGIDLKTLKTLRDYSYCSQHPGIELEYINEKDGHLYCKTCLITNQCQGIKELSGDALEPECQTLKESISKLSIYAKAIIDAKTKNVTESKEAVENVSKTIQEIRTKINNLLDNLEETTKEQAKAILKNTEILSETDKVVLTESIAFLNNASHLIDNVVKYGTIGQMFTSLEKTKEVFQNCELSICTMSDAFKPESPKLVIKDSLENIMQLGLNETSSLATVSKASNTIALPKYHNTNSLENASVLKTEEKSVKEDYSVYSSRTYCSMIFFPNDQAVLIDCLHQRCSLTNKTYDVIGSRKINKVWSCSYTKDGQLVVNSTVEQRLYYLSFDNGLEVIKEVKATRKPRTIQALSNGDFAVGWTKPVAFGIISSEADSTERVYFTEDKSGRKLKSFDYMAIDEDRQHVIQPCTTDNALYCFDFDGDAKFEYRSSDLNNPQGVALDGNGNIFLCSSGNSVIHVISPTGKAIKIIKEGCPNLPLAIAFKPCRDEFAVTRGYVAGEDDRVITFFKIQREK